MQNTELMYIKLPMYLFFYMALGHNNFDAGKSITQALLPFQAQKSLNFRAHPFPMVLVMDVASNKIITSCAI